MKKEASLSLERVKNIYESFTLSGYYNVILSFIVCSCYLFNREDVGFLILIIIIVTNFILIDDVMPFILPILCLCILPLRLYDGQEPIWRLWPLGIHVVISILFHVIYYKKKYKKSEFIKPLIAISIALLAGGLFVIPAKDYFAFNTIIYTVGLGPGMIAFYLFFRHYINPKKQYKTFDAIVNIANIVGVIIIAMLVMQYAQNIVLRLINIPEGEPRKAILRNFMWKDLQFGNNLSTFLLMVIPFSFYKAFHSKEGNYKYVILGVVECLTMIFSMSRSGIILGVSFIVFYALQIFSGRNSKRKLKNVLSFILPIICVSLIVLLKHSFWQELFSLAFGGRKFSDKKLAVLLFSIVSFGLGLYIFLNFINKNIAQRKDILMGLEIAIVIGLAVLVLFWERIFKIVVRIDVARSVMANFAISNLFKYPLFGTGMGYKGMHEIYKPHEQMLNAYHNIVFQVIGSMGLVGILAYGYFFHKKYALLLKIENNMFFYYSLPIIGLHIMSLVNPGVIIPVPYAMFEVLMLCLAETYIEERVENTLAINLYICQNVNI